MKLINIPITNVGIPSVVVGSIFVFAYVGFLPLYFGWDEYRYYGEGIQDSILVLKAFLLTCVTISMLLLGVTFSKYNLKAKVMPQIYWNQRNINVKETYLLVILLIFSFIILLLYLSAVPQIAIISLFTDGVVKAASARSSMANDFPGRYHWYSLVMHDLLNVITFCFFSAWLRLSKSKYLSLFLLSLIGSIIAAIMAIQKAPLIWLLIGLFFVYALNRFKGKIPVLSVLKLLFITVVLLVVFYMAFMGTENISIALKVLFSRAFTGGVAPSYYYLEFFPKTHDFLYGTSFPNPGGVFPFTPYPLTVEVNNWKFPFLVEQGIVGSAPTIFWAEVYANFGVAGVFVFPFFVGMFLSFIAHFVNKLENTPIKVGLIVWLILHYFHLSDSGVSGYLFDFYLTGILFFIGSLIVLANNFKLKYIKYYKVINE